MTVIEQLHIGPGVKIRRWKSTTGEHYTVEAGDKSRKFVPAEAWLMLAYARRMVEWESASTGDCMECHA